MRIFLVDKAEWPRLPVRRRPPPRPLWGAPPVQRSRHRYLIEEGLFTDDLKAAPPVIGL
jgi:hypothetical protein